MPATPDGGAPPTPAASQFHRRRETPPVVSIAKHMHHEKQRTGQAVVSLERSAITIAVASFQDVVFFGAILPDERARCCAQLVAELDRCLVRASSRASSNADSAHPSIFPQPLALLRSSRTYPDARDERGRAWLVSPALMRISKRAFCSEEQGQWHRVQAF
ncbi:hypothetical protein GTA08_BOTSDO13256 [Botryosphaeria dothidea]|uniref:Uncharacterized protein n=1 Tax=Botryosphaeria dothidea TaxID=55169 RepID=A0A8H4J1U6_9PEZI|nr:hypothetical protein GTA08_BOTSDO13256 [Botryosphaeria dothidea]